MRRAHARQHKAKGMHIAGWLAAQLKTQAQTQTVGASLEYNAPNLSSARIIKCRQGGAFRVIRPYRCMQPRSLTLSLYEHNHDQPIATESEFAPGNSDES